MSSARPWRCRAGPAGRLRRGGRSRSRGAFGGREGGLGWTSVVVGPAISSSNERRRPKSRAKKRREKIVDLYFCFPAPLSTSKTQKTKMQNQQSNAPPSEVLAAALENRAGEIGLAFLDTRRGR